MNFITINKNLQQPTYWQLHKSLITDNVSTCISGFQVIAITKNCQRNFLTAKRNCVIKWNWIRNISYTTSIVRTYKQCTKHATKNQQLNSKQFHLCIISVTNILTRRQKTPTESTNVFIGKYSVTAL